MAAYHPISDTHDGLLRACKRTGSFPSLAVKSCPTASDPIADTWGETKINP